MSKWLTFGFLFSLCFSLNFGANLNDSNECNFYHVYPIGCIFSMMNDTFIESKETFCENSEVYVRTYDGWGCSGNVTKIGDTSGLGLNSSFYNCAGSAACDSVTLFLENCNDTNIVREDAVLINKCLYLGNGSYAEATCSDEQFTMIYYNEPYCSVSDLELTIGLNECKLNFGDYYKPISINCSASPIVSTTTPDIFTSTTPYIDNPLNVHDPNVCNYAYLYPVGKCIISTDDRSLKLRCENDEVWFQEYKSSDCSGTIVVNQKVNDSYYNCAGSFNCPSATVTQLSCDGTNYQRIFKPAVDTCLKIDNNTYMSASCYGDELINTYYSGKCDPSNIDYTEQVELNDPCEDADDSTIIDISCNEYESTVIEPDEPNVNDPDHCNYYRVFPVNECVAWIQSSSVVESVKFTCKNNDVWFTYYESIDCTGEEKRSEKETDGYYYNCAGASSCPSSTVISQSCDDSSETLGTKIVTDSCTKNGKTQYLYTRCNDGESLYTRYYTDYECTSLLYSKTNEIGKECTDDTESTFTDITCSASFFTNFSVHFILMVFVVYCFLF